MGYEVGVDVKKFSKKAHAGFSDQLKRPRGVCLVFDDNFLDIGHAHPFTCGKMCLPACSDPSPAMFDGYR